MVNHPSHIKEALELLDLHYESFHKVAPFASKTGHPVPMDTRGWSQILASVLTGIKGLERQKGADLDDGSDVKGANTWMAIDTPRFNGVIKAGTKSSTSGKIESVDEMPHLYLVLWDETARNSARCRIWVIRTQQDLVFRDVCLKWYEKKEAGEIKSNNFQLHPPRGKDINEIRNTCGNLEYPLFFSAEKLPDEKYKLTAYNPQVRDDGCCTLLS
jgi:hypothetical protein